MNRLVVSSLTVSGPISALGKKNGNTYVTINRTGYMADKDFMEITFDELDETEEEEEPVVVKKKDYSSLLLICGAVALLVGALLGHGSAPDNKTRETAYIVLLIVGSLLSVIGLYYSFSKNKAE